MNLHSFYKNKFQSPKYNGYQNFSLGEHLKVDADLAMEETWWNDPQSKRCYIYDYFHDDQPHLARGMTYNFTTKTPIDAKFIIKSHGSLAKDQVEAQIMFRPSQKYEFCPGDDLYYLEDYRKKYGEHDVMIGCYIDIPDQHGVYEKWMICLRDVRAQFQKYFVLPCTYNLHWIEESGNERIKRKMWSVIRSQSS